MNREVQTWGGQCPPVHKSAAAALRRASAVEGLRRDVLDRTDLQAGGLQGADRGLAAGAGTLDEDVNLLHAVLLGAPGGGLGGELGGVGGRLARALEADLAGGAPGDDGALRVRQRDDGVVEGGLDVGVTVGNVLAVLAARLARGGAGLGRHSSFFVMRSSLRPALGGARAAAYLAFFLPATVRLGPLRVRALVLVR